MENEGENPSWAEHDRIMLVQRCGLSFKKSELLAKYSFLGDIPKNPEKVVQNLLAFKKEIVPSILDEGEFEILISRVKVYSKYREAVVSSPERRRRGGLSRLLRRHRALKKLGLKGKGKVTVESAEEFFLDMYGMSYKELQKKLGPEERFKKDTPLLLLGFLHGVKDEKKHVILFPLAGMLFIYYMARGILYEMQSEGLAKGISLYTVQTAAMTLNYDADRYDKSALQDYTRLQLKKIIKRSGAKSISVVDEIALGRTLSLIREVAAENAVPLIHIIDAYHGGNLPGMISPRDVVLKQKHGKVIPLSHARKMDIPKDTSYRFFLEHSDAFSIGYVKELLFYFGRVYYRMADHKEAANYYNQYNQEFSINPPVRVQEFPSLRI